MHIPFFSPRKPDEPLSWLTNLRQVTAADLLSGDSLATGTWQAMQENKNLAEQFMRDKSFLCAKAPLLGFPPKSQACSRLFTPLLKTLEGDLGVHQAALIACIHLLPAPTARALFLSLKPVPGYLDDEMLPIYLGTILMLSSWVSSCGGTSIDFPPIIRLLEAIGNMACEDLLPLTLVEQVLTAWGYQKNLAYELNKMRVQCRWYEAERLVRGLSTVLALPRVAGMAHDIFPSHKMGAAWKPCQYRIEQWRSPHLEPHRDALIYILKLDGPDFSSKCAATLGIDKCGKRFIKPWDLAPQAAQALNIGANHLHGAVDASALATAIVELGEALLAATWLHACPWSGEFLGMLPRVVDTREMWPGKTTPPSKAYVGWLETTVSHGIVGVPKVPQTKSLLDGRNPPPDPPAARRCSKKKKKKIRVVEDTDWVRRAEEDQMESGPSVAPTKRNKEVVLGSKPGGDERFLGAVLEEEDREVEVRSEARPPSRGKKSAVVTSKKKKAKGKGPGKIPAAADKKTTQAANTLARMRRDIQEIWEEVRTAVGRILDEPGDEEFCQFDVLSMIIEEEEEG
ncbi:hypothetical protein B0T18DRAFT_430767 [Schizothecium vesticola]|uniref:Uncharacterized protein n=1 Tax=Schizothecium vesticola TaxID=314040 RepID=A0AA40EQ78_9PEZI|nr:hypothetical protein B0T18DRAFT_430767 [Schizothecium vesticola]